MKITLTIINEQLTHVNKMLPKDKTLSTDQAFGGVKLIRKIDSNGAEETVSPRGTRQDIYNFLLGMAKTLELLE